MERMRNIDTVRHMTRKRDYQSQAIADARRAFDEAVITGTGWYVLDFDELTPINLRPKLLSVAVSNTVGWSKVPHLTQPPLTWD